MYVRLSALLVAFVLLIAACGGDATTTTTTTTIATDADTTTSLAPGTTEATTTAVPEDEPAGATSEGPAESGDLVAVDYTGLLDSGEEFDSSAGREPLEFTLGSGQVIPGFDDAVEGLSVGDTVTVRIEPENAYGMPDPEAVVDFPIEEVPEEFQEVGIPVQFATGQTGVVTEVTEDTVTIDLNHALAGEALTFEITLVSITPGG